MDEEIVFTTEDVSRNKGFGIFAYLGILVLIPICAAKDSLYARFHANQGLVLLLTEVALNIVGRIVGFILKVATFGIMNNLIGMIINLIVILITLIYVFIGVVNAFSGEARKLPIIGGITLLH